MVEIFTTFFAVSLSCIPGVCLLLLLRNLLHKKMAAGVICVMWAVLCARLLLPVTISLPKPVIAIPRIDSQQVIITMQPQEQTPKAASQILLQEHPKDTIAQTSPKQEYVFSAPVFFTYIWIIGAILYGAYLVLGRVYLSKTIKRWKHSKIDEALQAYAGSAAREIGFAPKIRFIQCSKIGSPMLTGVFRPYLLLPNVERYTQEQWQFVLLHELMHLKRRDLLLSGLHQKIFCWS